MDDAYCRDSGGAGISCIYDSFAIQRSQAIIKLNHSQKVPCCYCDMELFCEYNDFVYKKLL